MSEAQRFPELRALQSVFWRLMVAPEGVAAGARALRAEGAGGLPVVAAEAVAGAARFVAGAGRHGRFDDGGPDR